MKYFIVFESNGNPVVDWDYPLYRNIVLTGSTYSEVELREWVSRVWHVEPNATIHEIAKAIAAGGWSLLEKIS